MKYLKKGAMFGLDARVALAIFGALSIITGAALYNSIQSAKIVAIATEMDNIDKALTEFLIDTGTYPIKAASTPSGQLKTEDLILPPSPTVAGWKGPYIGFADDATANNGYLIHSNYSLVMTFHAVDTAWAQPAAGTRCLTTTPGSCSIYICYDKVPVNILPALDVRIDGSDDNDAGNFRYNGTVGCKRGLTFDKALGI